MCAQIGLWLYGKIDWFVRFIVRIVLQFVVLIVVQVLLTIVDWLDMNLEEFEAYLIDKIVVLKGEASDDGQH